MNERIEGDELSNMIQDLVKDSISLHTIQIFKIKDGSYLPYGSGVLACSHKYRYIFSASHVIDYMSQGNNLYFQTSDHDFVEIIGQWRTSITGDDIVKPDLAYIRLHITNVNSLLAIGRQFLPVDKILSDYSFEAGNVHIMYGFPESFIKYNNGVMETGGKLLLVNLSSDKAYKHYNVTKDTHYILDYRKPIDLNTKKKSKTIPLHGMSGCGLWMSTVFEDDDGSTVVEYFLIGIMHYFNYTGKFQVIIGDKIGLLTHTIGRFEEVE